LRSLGECESEEQTGRQITVRVIRQFGKDENGFENTTLWASECRRAGCGETNRDKF